MKLLLFASLGGAIGAGARYLVNVGMARALGPQFPWSTFLVNVVGCGLMGLLFVVLTRRYPEHEGAQIFLTTGILGGFTTFSAFALDFFVLIERGESGSAIVYGLGTVFLALAAFAVGAALARGTIA